MIGQPSCGYFKSLKFLGWLVKMCSLVDSVSPAKNLEYQKKRKKPKSKQNPTTCELKK